LLLTALALQAAFAMKSKSPTCDEFAHHLANGYSYLITHDFRMNPASPPLSRIVPAIPLYFMGAKLPLDHESWAQGDTVAFAKEFFYQTNGDCVNRYVFWSRVPVVLLSVVFGLAVFLFARHLLGILGGVLSLFFYVFSPNILAHSGLATADLMVAFFFFLALIALWAYLTKPSGARLVLLGICIGGSFLSKYSALILPPILFLITLAAGRFRQFTIRRYAAVAAVALITIWAGYFFEVKPLLEHTPDPAKKEAMYLKVGGEPLRQFAEKVPVPLSTFASSIVSMGVTRYNGRDAYFMGQWSREGWWQYYLVAMAIKETIPLLILSVAGVFLMRRWGWNRLTAVVIMVPVIAFFVFTLRDKAQAGIRYFLPIFPVLFILAGGSAAWLWHRRSPAAKVLCSAFLIWHMGSALMIYPDYLTYFNEFIGGPANGYKYLRDSNIDWCQDLKGVGEWSVRQGYSEVVLLYHGVEDPAYYGIPHRSFEKDEFLHPRSTVYAIGVHGIDSAVWPLKVKPAHIVGRSFYIYDFRNGVPKEIQ
jgi:hypothetical protein